MKAKVSRGGGFRGALNYIFDEGKKATGNKQPEVVGGNMAGRNAGQLSNEFATTRALRPGVQRPVWHCSLTLPAGEHLDVDGWSEVADAFMSKMGFSDRHPRIVVRHCDTEYDHIHILASRIDFDATLWHGQWEAYKAIEATQELECRFHLTITPGLGSASAESKRLSANELNMAVRKGEAPPRQQLQHIIDSVLDQGEISALDFAEALELAGVGVRANMASTGRMSGFSFEYEGIAFKASKLGKAYSWKRLQERGLTYEQDRDRAGLERFAQRPGQPAGAVADPAEGAAGADRRLGDGAGAAPGGGTSSADRAAAPGDSSAGERGIGTPGGVESGGDREAGPAPADDAQYHGHRADQGGDQELREIDEAIAAEDQRDIGGAGADDAEPESRRRGSGEAASGHGSAASASRGDAAEVVEGASPSSEQRLGERRRRGGDDWNTRFKRASAARRRERTAGSGSDAALAGERHSGGGRVAERDLQSARTVDPTGYLEAHGFRVKWQGKHASVCDGRGDEHYRLTRKADGRTLWCDLHGNHGGDVIALVRELEPDAPFADAVYRLLVGTAPVGSTEPQRAAERPKRYPSMTMGGLHARDTGYRYLQARGIAQEVIEHAERVGMLRFDPNGAALFVGVDANGRPRNVTRRASDRQEAVQKRDLKGSDKSYPPILPGSSGASVWIVEGGVDALAVQTLAATKGQPVPHVIVSGGSGVRSFLENPRVRELIEQAQRVVVAADNERDDEIQQRTDAQHAAQVEATKAINTQVELWHPPKQCGDLADLNALVQRQERDKRQRQRVEEMMNRQWQPEKVPEKAREDEPEKGPTSRTPRDPNSGPGL